MIWNGKRIKGVQAFVGRAGGDFAGEYILVSVDSWRAGQRGPFADCIAPVLAGVQDSLGSCSISAGCLQESYYPVSQRKIPTNVQSILGRWLA